MDELKIPDHIVWNQGAPEPHHCSWGANSILQVCQAAIKWVHAACTDLNRSTLLQEPDITYLPVRRGVLVRGRRLQSLQSTCDTRCVLRTNFKFGEKLITPWKPPKKKKKNPRNNIPFKRYSLSAVFHLLSKNKQSSPTVEMKHTGWAEFGEERFSHHLF